MRVLLMQSSALAAASLLASAAAAITPVPAPPTRVSVDGNGVDLSTGALNLSARHLSIGPDGPAGMAFERYWSGNGWRDSLAAGISGSTSHPIVSIGGQSYSFTWNGSTYVDDAGSGATLTLSGSYTFTSRDGTIATFFPANGQFDRFAANIGWVNYIRWPNGTRWSFSYRGENYCPHELDPENPSCSMPMARSVRLQSVVNNFGYQLKLNYESNVISAPWDVDAWQALSKVTAINNAVEACDQFADNCSLNNNWPTLTISGSWLTDASGANWQYDIDANGEISGVRRPTSSVNNLAVSYDGNGRVSSIVNEGIQTTYAWNSDTSSYPFRMTASISRQGSGTRTVVSESSSSSLAWNVVRDTDALSNASTYAYDSSDRLTRATAPEGNAAEYSYDARGNVTSVRSLAKGGSATPLVTSATYDGSCANPKTCNQPTSTTDARGKVTNYSYDATHGGVLAVTAPAPYAGDVRPETRYSYTQLGNGTYALGGASTCTNAASCTGANNEVKTSIAYAGSGNYLPTSASKGAGDGSLTATSSFTYDMIGNVLTVDGPLPGTGDTSRLRYDAVRRTVGVVSPDPDGGGPLRPRAQRISYDADGKATQTEVGTVTDQSDGAWSGFKSFQQIVTGWDNATGRVVSRRMNAGGATYALVQYAYDAAGRPICVAQRMNAGQFGNPSGDACTPGQASSDGPDRITLTSYDQLDRAVRVTTGYGVSPRDVASTGYTANGQVQWAEDAKGNRTSYVYDGFDRLSQTQYPSSTPHASNGGDYEQLGYDAGSNIVSRRLRNNSTIVYAYDDLNRLVGKTPPTGNSNLNAAFSYDLLGRMTSARNSGSIYATSSGFRYDALDRRVQETATLSNSLFLYHALEYDLAGRRTRYSWSNDGFFTTYEYNVLGEMTAIRENGSAQLAGFSYDDLGRRTRLDRGNGTSTTYSYDAGSRLTRLSLNGGSAPIAYDYGYNPAGQITSRTASNDLYAWGGAVNVNRGYTPNALNQYAAITSTPATPGALTVSYDPRGNMTQAGTVAYSYSAENELALAGSTRIYYDALHRLVMANVSPVVRREYDGDQLVAEYSGTSNGIMVRRYVFGPNADEPIMWYEGSGTGDKRWLAADERGSVVQVTDAGGTVVARNAYDEYGIPGANNQGRFQYTGQAWLPELGMYDYKARIYSTTLGRFMQTDPIGYGDGMNWYNYVGSDPVNRSDPSGMVAVVEEPPVNNSQEQGITLTGKFPCDGVCFKFDRFTIAPITEIPDPFGNLLEYQDIPEYVVMAKKTPKKARTPQSPIRTSPAVKKFVCGTLANNGYNRDRAANAAYAYRNDPNHPGQKFNPVARAGENWLAAAGYNTYYPGGNLNGYKGAIYAWQYLKLVPFLAPANDGFSQDALDAGLDGHEHQYDTPEQLQDMCLGK